ncbi:MAG: flagellar protein FliS [Pseudomonadota bacterium]|jgi:flagellar secretion chaperone FliS
MLHRNALKAYEQAETDFAVEGADRHRLIELLFAELLGSLDRSILAIETGDYASRSAAQTKALSIIMALAGSLDYERGQPVATTLGELYEWARIQLIESNRSQPVERLTAVRKSMAGIAEAWSMIGKPATNAA